ncbi:phosphonate C-P lyase system protein PhnH, partial [Klebsiella aerogenes]
MSLLTGFEQPIDQSQHAFRLILKALSEPGHRVTLPAGPAWAPLNAASTAALLT